MCSRIIFVITFAMAENTQIFLQDLRSPGKRNNSSAKTEVAETTITREDLDTQGSSISTKGCHTVDSRGEVLLPPS